jgi:hypothetical protein
VKRLIAIAALSSALGVGTTACAHKQLTNEQLARKTVTVTAVVGLVVLTLVAANSGPR